MRVSLFLKKKVGSLPMEMHQKCKGIIYKRTECPTEGASTHYDVICPFALASSHVPLSIIPYYLILTK